MKVLWLLLLLPTVAMAKTGSWPQLYNDGVRTYQSNDFARAAAAFETATSTQDRSLQERAYYNLGNASYRLGESAPARAQQLWERALKSYETAMALDPKDADAKFNHDFVKKKLEKLKKQQQEQPQQNRKNHQDKPQEQKQNEQEQQQQDQQQQNSQDKQSQQQDEQQSQQSQEQQKKDQEQKNKQQQQQTQQEKQSNPEQQPPETDGQRADYDKMQAAALLDGLRENERNWNFFPEAQMKDLKDSGAPAKDW